jgi:unsaturated rhamnogalacturonyl hydrolase
MMQQATLKPQQQGVAAGILKAIRLGYLDDSYLPVAERAIAGV